MQANTTQNGMTGTASGYTLALIRHKNHVAPIYKQVSGILPYTVKLIYSVLKNIFK